jgi:hypothetical protein
MRRHAGSVFHLVSEGCNTTMAGEPRYILAADPEGFTDVKRSTILSDGRWTFRIKTTPVLGIRQASLKATTKRWRSNDCNTAQLQVPTYRDAV